MDVQNYPTTKNKQYKNIHSILIRIIRKKINWLHLLCVNPDILYKQESFKEAYDLHNYFKDVGIIEFIRDNYHKISRNEFLKQLLERIGLYLDDQELIDIEVEKINSLNKSIDREIHRFPHNNYNFLCKYGNQLFLNHYFEISGHSSLIDFYTLVSIICSRGHSTIFKISKNQIIAHLNNNTKYRVYCSDCSREFILSKDLRHLMEVSGTSRILDEQYFGPDKDFTNLNLKRNKNQNFSL